MLAGNNVYAKLNYDLAAKTSAALSVEYDKGNRNNIMAPSLNFKELSNSENARTSLIFKSSISKEVDGAITLWQMHNDLSLNDCLFSTGDLFQSRYFNETGYGTSAHLGHNNC